MAGIWKIHHPATRSRAQPKNFSGSSSWNFQRDSESLDRQLMAVYSQCCCYSNRDAQAWTEERDRTSQFHSLSPIVDSLDTFCHLNHLKWQKATPTASCGCCPPRTGRRGKQGAAQGVQATVGREEQHQSPSQPPNGSVIISSSGISNTLPSAAAPGTSP